MRSHIGTHVNGDTFGGFETEPVAKLFKHIGFVECFRTLHDRPDMHIGIHIGKSEVLSDISKLDHVQQSPDDRELIVGVIDPAGNPGPACRRPLD